MLISSNYVHFKIMHNFVMQLDCGWTAILSYSITMSRNTIILSLLAKIINAAPIHMTQSVALFVQQSRMNKESQI